MPRFNPIRGVPTPPPPAAIPDREALIQRIAAAAHTPCWPIVPSFNSPGDFCYFDNYHNTYIGQAYPSEQAARAAWEEKEDKLAAAFLTELRQMSDADLQRQANYWLKQTSPVEIKPKAAPGKPVKLKTHVRVTLKTTTHTKHGYPIWIAQLDQRVDRSEFKRLLGLAKAGGGYWSNFGPVEIHGFIFKEEVKAQAFAQLLNPAPEPEVITSHPPCESVAERGAKAHVAWKEVQHAIGAAAAAPIKAALAAEPVPEPLKIPVEFNPMPAWKLRLRRPTPTVPMQ